MGDGTLCEFNKLNGGFHDYACAIIMLFAVCDIVVDHFAKMTVFA